MRQEPDRQQLALLYGKENIAEHENQIGHVLQEFEAQFGGPARVLVSAPGRTEIGGNHTDHQNG